LISLQGVECAMYNIFQCHVAYWGPQTPGSCSAMLNK